MYAEEGQWWRQPGMVFFCLAYSTPCEDDVLQSHRDAMQRAALVRRDSVQTLGLPQDQVAVQMGPCPHGIVSLVDAPEQRADIIHHGYVARLYQGGGVRCRDLV